ncbi:uncharacterized protein LOC144701699 [Wolffia australiana]
MGKGEDGRSKYKGVRKRKWGRWVSEIRLPNSRERIWLGSYDTPEKAARAFDAAVVCLRGREGGAFNFPRHLPDIPTCLSLQPAEVQVVAARFANEPIPTESPFESPSESPSESWGEEQDALDWSFLDSAGSGSGPELGPDFGPGLEPTWTGFYDMVDNFYDMEFFSPVGQPDYMVEEPGFTSLWEF